MEHMLMMVGFGGEMSHVLMLVSALASFALALLVFRVRTDWTSKTYLILAIVLLPMYLNLEFFSHPEEMLSHAGMLDMWVRHGTFYAALMFLFLFTKRMFNQALEKEIADARTKMPFTVMTAGLFVFAGIILVFTYEMLSIASVPFTSYTTNHFLTDHGIQHIVVLVFFFFLLATMRLYSLYPSYASTRKYLIPLMLSGGSFVSLHVFEYFNETLLVFPFLSEEVGEYLEFFFQYLGVAFLGLTIALLLKLGRSTTVELPNHV